MLKILKNPTFLVSIGGAVEYYDILLFSLLSLYISLNFFPKTSPDAALIQTFIIIIIGNIARLIAGIAFGMAGDTRGRTKPFIISIFLISLATLSIGVLPTYETIGVYASILLLILKALQSAAYSAEIPGAVVIINETSEKKDVGKKTGFATGSAGIGAVFAMIIIAFCSSIFSTEFMVSWGWRLPFLLGASFAFFGFFLRNHLKEPVGFQEKKDRGKNKAILIKLFSEYKLTMLKITGLSLFVQGIMAFLASLPAFLNNFLHIPLSVAFKGLMIMSLSIFLTPICGLISDKIGRKKMLTYSVLLYAICVIPMFKLLTLKSVFALDLYFFISMIYNSVFAAAFFPLIAAFFPEDIRYTGASLTFNLGTVFSSFVPVIIITVMHLTNQIYLTSTFLIALALLAFLICLNLNKKIG